MLRQHPTTGCSADKRRQLRWPTATGASAACPRWHRPEPVLIPGPTCTSFVATIQLRAAQTGLWPGSLDRWLLVRTGNSQSTGTAWARGSSSNESTADTTAITPRPHITFTSARSSLHGALLPKTSGGQLARTLKVKRRMKTAPAARSGTALFRRQARHGEQRKPGHGPDTEDTDDAHRHRPVIHNGTFIRPHRSERKTRRRSSTAQASSVAAHSAPTAALNARS